MSITEALYLEYKDIPASQQTLKEHISIRLYELLRVEKNTREAVVTELSLLREKYIEIDVDNERLKNNLEKLTKSKKEREIELIDEISYLEATKKKMHDELTTKNLLLTTLETKGTLYDTLKQHSEQLEQENTVLQQQNLMSSITLKSLTEEKETRSLTVTEQSQQLDLLKQDKMYLSQQIDTLKSRVDTDVKEKERLTSKCYELKRQKEELVEKL